MIDKLIERWFLLPLAPGAVLVIGLLLFGAVALCSRARRSAGASRAIPSTVRLTAAAVIVAWALGMVAQIFWIRFPTISWWSLALPLVVSAVGFAVAMNHKGSSTVRTGTPALVGVRRTWRSFASPGLLATGGGLVAMLVVVTVTAGAASVRDENGAFIFLELAGNGTSSFYGWALGIPVLLGLALLTTVAIVTLSITAARPFADPSTVKAESSGRRMLTNALLLTATAATALTLGGALQIIGQAGSGGVSDAQWSTGFSSFATFFIWSGWALQVASFAVLAALSMGWTLVATSKEVPLMAPAQA